ECLSRCCGTTRPWCSRRTPTTCGAARGWRRGTPGCENDSARRGRMSWRPGRMSCWPPSAEGGPIRTLFLWTNSRAVERDPGEQEPNPGGPAVMPYSATVRGQRFTFADLRELLARANEEKSGDQLAGVAAANERERVAAKLALADVPLGEIVEHPLIDPDHDDV